MRAVASFDLDSFDGEPPYYEEDGLTHGRARIAKTFRGDIEGHGSVEMLAARAEAGSGYVALERVTDRCRGYATGPRGR